uniref:Secreted protein n=1 Tax=Anopheles arabiensis TaxID=7173 RepID=A0A8W7MTZ3_ANOAR
MSVSFHGHSFLHRFLLYLAQAECVGEQKEKPSTEEETIFGPLKLKLNRAVLDGTVLMEPVQVVSPKSNRPLRQHSCCCSSPVGWIGRFNLAAPPARNVTRLGRRHCSRRS